MQYLKALKKNTANNEKQFLGKSNLFMRSAGARGRGGSGNVWEGPHMPGERFWNGGINIRKKHRLFEKINITILLRGATDPALAL